MHHHQVSEPGEAEFCCMCHGDSTRTSRDIEEGAMGIFSMGPGVSSGDLKGGDAPQREAKDTTFLTFHSSLSLADLR
jgi:hypothetical protein